MKKCFSAAGAVIFCLSVLLTGCANSADGDPEPVKTGQEEGQQGKGDSQEGQQGDGGSQGGSQQGGGQQGGQGENGGSQSGTDDIVYNNPIYDTSSAKSLDFIFNNQTLGTTTIVINRSEWDKLCDDYRYFYKNENCVHAEAYTYEKDGYSWTLKDVGFRLRGNTSRYCPQGVDNGNEQGQMNESWNAGYYEYASKPNNDYRQTHFKVDFEEFLEDNQDQKMSNCMKGVALKRMDSSCTREIFCYDLFRKNGIWTAPRASHTRLILKIREDKSEDTTKITTVDFGVYEMFEEVNKQSLKARASDKDENKAENAWTNNKGNLWKCANSLVEGKENMGVEDIRIIHKGDEVPADMQENGREDETHIGYIWNSYNQDLKTNKDKFSEAKTEFQSFISGLNALSDDEEEIKTFYEKWFDVDFFIKTYAINIICGMDDDYWGNSNNYYLYFDTGKKGTGKIYFIPFDYDNTLGASIKDGGFKHNPLDWGRGVKHPLIDNLLKVSEFKALFIKYLIELTAKDSLWNYERCSKMFLDWQKMLKDYIKSPDLNYTGLGVSGFGYGTWQPGGYSLVDRGTNIYDATRNYFNYWLKGIDIPNIISVDKTATGGGLIINIDTDEIPEDAAIRKFYINGKQVADVGFSTDSNGKISVPSLVFDNKWAFPFVEAGNTYKVVIEFQNSNYSTIYTSPELTVTATSGLGDYYFENTKYTVDSNILVFNQEPELYYGNGYSLMNGGHWVLELEDEYWNYQSWNWLGDKCSGFDFGKNGVVKNPDNKLMFRLYYVISTDNYGDYRFVLFEWDDTKYFKVK